MTNTTKQIPHSECIQGTCVNVTTGCVGECALRAAFPLDNVACGDAVSRQAAPEAPTAWLATDLDGRGDVGFTKEEAKRRAGEGCTEFFPLFDVPTVAAPEAPASDDEFIKNVLSDLAKRGASAAGLSLAVQLLGAGACDGCGYRQLHCRCIGQVPFASPAATTGSQSDADKMLAMRAEYDRQEGAAGGTLMGKATTASAGAACTACAGKNLNCDHCDGMGIEPRKVVDYKECYCLPSMLCDGKCKPIYADEQRTPVSAPPTTASASGRKEMDVWNAGAKALADRAPAPSREAAPQAAAAVWEFVAAIANNYDAYDSADDETSCRGCSALIEDGQTVAHQPGCIVPRAQAWIAAHPGEAPAEGVGQ